METIHGMDNIGKPIGRWLEPRLAWALRAMPVVVVTGARQTGKTILANVLTPGRRYETLDDIDVLAQAERDPASLLAELPTSVPSRATLTMGKPDFFGGGTESR